MDLTLLSLRITVFEFEFSLSLLFSSCTDFSRTGFKFYQKKIESVSMLIRTGIYPCRNLDCDLYQFGKIENQFQFLPVGFEIPPDLFRISALASIFHGFVKLSLIHI